MGMGGDMGMWMGGGVRKEGSGVSGGGKKKGGTKGESGKREWGWGWGCECERGSGSGSGSGVRVGGREMAIKKREYDDDEGRGAHNKSASGGDVSGVSGVSGGVGGVVVEKEE